jgi:hypothetical protein
MSAPTPDNISLLALLLVLGAHGCVVTTRDGQLYVSNRRTLPAGATEAIKRHRDQLLLVAGSGA